MRSQITISFVLKRSWVSREAGCRHWQDAWTDPDIPECTNGTQFVRLTDLTAELGSKDFTTITKMTKCLVRWAILNQKHSKVISTFEGALPVQRVQTCWNPGGIKEPGWQKDIWVGSLRHHGDECQGGEALWLPHLPGGVWRGSGSVCRLVYALSVWPRGGCQECLAKLEKVTF